MNHDWTPILSGNTYCSPACGCDCTLEEYNEAVRKADELVTELGKPFHPRVWENLGWHYSAGASIPSEAHVTVNYSESIQKYWVDLRVTGQQEIAYGYDAKDAVANAVAVMQAKIDQAVLGLAHLNTLLTSE